MSTTKTTPAGRSKVRHMMKKRKRCAARMLDGCYRNMPNDSKQPVSKTGKKQEDQSPSSSKPILATPEDSTKDVHAQRIGTKRDRKT
ncbi:hypothetical protein Tco_1037255 [Tanacetum coccineum]